MGTASLGTEVTAPGPGVRLLPVAAPPRPGRPPGHPESGRGTHSGAGREGTRASWFPWRQRALVVGARTGRGTESAGTFLRVRQARLPPVSPALLGRRRIAARQVPRMGLACFWADTQRKRPPRQWP